MTDDDLALVPVMNQLVSHLIRLMKQTGEVPDPIVWDELRVYMPPIGTAGPLAHDAGYDNSGKG